MILYLDAAKCLPEVGKAVGAVQARFGRLVKQLGRVSK